MIRRYLPYDLILLSNYQTLIFSALDSPPIKNYQYLEVSLLTKMSREKNSLIIVKFEHGIAAKLSNQ
jgi:hypothetical protein